MNKPLEPTIRNMPLTPRGRDNYDRIFRRVTSTPTSAPTPTPSTPAPKDTTSAITPGMIREYRSDCCEAPLAGRGVCSECQRPCRHVLTKIN